MIMFVLSRTFTIRRRAYELGERLDVARLEMTRMLEKQDGVLSRQDSMLDLQRKTIDTIKLEGEKTRGTISIHVSNDLVDIRQEIIHMKENEIKFYDSKPPKVLLVF